jgi:hypothetical protein
LWEDSFSSVLLGKCSLTLEGEVVGDYLLRWKMTTSSDPAFFPVGICTGETGARAQEITKGLSAALFVSRTNGNSLNLSYQGSGIFIW